MAIKCNSPFLHNGGVYSLDNLPYSKQFIKINFVQEGLRTSQSFCLRFQTPNSLNTVTAHAL